MSRNGSGTYTPPTNSWSPAVNGASATASDWTATLADLSAALTQSLSADGQTPVTGNLVMGSNKLTVLAAGTTAGDSTRYEQVFGSTGITTLANSAGASAVGFIQAGTGAVATTVQAKLRGFLAVTDFGAVGDGSTNDTTAFQNATAAGAPAYVPYSANFYVVTALTNAEIALLWGPGVVKISGAVQQISSAPNWNGTETAYNRMIRPVWAPAKWSTVDGSLTNGASYSKVTRSGGFGSYGVDLVDYLVTDSLSSPEIDVGRTTWVSATNLTGGSVFGAWDGANTPSAYLGQTYSSGSVIGNEINIGNRWANFGLQTDVGGTRYTVGQQIVPDVIPSPDGINSTSCTITVATPGVVTVNSHGYTANMGVVFDGAGTIPTGLTKGVAYFVSATGLATNTFQVSATIGGSSIATTGSFVAPITVTPSYPGSFGGVVSQSIWGHQWWVGTFIRGESICAGGYGNLARGGNNAAGAPAAWSNVTGYWGIGLDFAAAICSGTAINFSFTDSHAATATAGGATLPATPQGFIKLSMGGTVIKVPYYQN